MQTAIKWFANNPVAANLLMFFLIITGLYGALTTNQEEFPNFELKVIAVTVPYLGAAPIEAEKAVCVRIEEAIEGVEGIEKLYGMATEGQCTVSAMLFSDADEVTATNEIKSRVDGINSFPVETEKPIFTAAAMTRKVMQIALFGPISEYELKELGRELREQIVQVEGISQVAIEYVRPMRYQSRSLKKPYDAMASHCKKSLMQCDEAPLICREVLLKRTLAKS